MQKVYVIFAAIVTYASAATVMDSNVFMDTVLTQKMPSLVRGNTRLYPFSSIPDFNFKIKSTGLFNRDLKVNATEGAIRHLDTAPHRKGSCQPPVLVGGKTTVACELDLSGVNTTFLAKVGVAASDKPSEVHFMSCDASAASVVFRCSEHTTDEHAVRNVEKEIILFRVAS